MKQWYETLFENFSQKYENESFTKGTKAEVDFLEAEINYNKSLSILDIGCGTGRHSIELALRGYNVKGIDLSENMLSKARENAKKANVKVDFTQADARSFHLNEKFDLVIMLCEGGFSLMETDMMNFEILKNASNSLKSGGKFIFNCLNALYPLYHSVKDLINEGSTGTHEGSFDIMKFREFSTYVVNDDDGKELNLKCNERYYSPSEINFMLDIIGFSRTDIMGCDIGLFSREMQLETTNYQMLVISEK